MDGLFWDNEIFESPLMKRARVCQERLFSPRVLHFRRSQMFGECQDLGACETFPENLPSETDSTSSYRSKRLLLFKGGDSFLRQWGPMISLYSNGNLTRISDKCIAFAGIVEETQALAPSRYLAGFADTILSSNYYRKYMAALHLVGHNPTSPHRGHGFRSMALFSRIHLFNAK